jgi:glycosyltransferase involved in cell wall biosynthesis
MCMRCPTLSQLPPAPADRSGWPWTVETFALPDTLPSGAPWPRITIVTPSYNQAQFLEETIRSVLLQGYPDLEYIIIDGGSTDGSAAIIQRYAPWLAYWVSEPDRGQSHAINKGFARASGAWLGWINSDDFYAPGALQHLIECAVAQDTPFVAGNSIRFGEELVGGTKRVQPLPEAFEYETLRRAQWFDQPACLWTHDLFDQAGPLEEDLHFAFDWQFFARCAALAPAAVTNEVIAYYRIHAAHKTGSGGHTRLWELVQVYECTLDGDDLRAVLRVRRWFTVLLWVRSLKRRYGHHGYPLLRILFSIMVVDRDPPLHPYIAYALDLPHCTQPLPVIKSSVDDPFPPVESA